MEAVGEAQLMHLLELILKQLQRKTPLLQLMELRFLEQLMKLLM